MNEAATNPTSTRRARRAKGIVVSGSLLATIALIILVVTHRDAHERPSTASTSTTAGVPRFVTTGDAVRASCARDARVLGWDVPCPTVLPAVEDQLEWCDGSCVYTGGEPPIPMFYLSVEYSGPAPLGPTTVRHLVIEAFPRDAPGVLDPPCARFEPVPALTTSLGRLEKFRCLEPTPAQAARVMHGEAIHTNHDVVRWYRHGIAYVVSIHRSGFDTRQILRTVAEKIIYVP